MTKIYNPLIEPVKIQEHKKNIIIDFMGTMVYENPSWYVSKEPLTRKEAIKIYQEGMILRPGIKDFFEAYKNNDENIVIHSDTSKQQIKSMLNGTGKYIKGICAGTNFMFEEQFRDLNTNNTYPRLIKNLEKTCQTYNFKPDETIFIGDTVIDVDSANKYNLDMILVPHSEIHPTFNFKELLPQSKIDYLNSLEDTAKQYVKKII